MTTYRLLFGYPGYRVGDDGSVWSRRRTGPGAGLAAIWRRLTGGTDKDGYKKVILCRSGYRRYCRVHVLVLEAFVGPCPSGYESRHLNNRRRDNRLTNLEWSPHAVNIADKRRHGTAQVGSRHPLATITESQARTVKKLLVAGYTPAAIAARLNVSRATVYGIKYGRSWTHVEV